MPINSEFISVGEGFTARLEAMVGSGYDAATRTGGVLTNKSVISSEVIMSIEHIAYGLPDGRVCVRRTDLLTCRGSHVTVFATHLEWMIWNRNRLDGIRDPECS